MVSKKVAELLGAVRRKYGRLNVEQKLDFWGLVVSTMALMLELLKTAFGLSG